MQHFAQLSDPHLSTLQGVRARQLLNKRALGYLSWRRRRRFEHRAEVLEALQRDLAQFTLDQLLVTGDLTHIGLPSEFRQAQAWLRELGEASAVAVVPGNHDASVAAPWEDTFALWRDYMASDGVGGGREERDLFPSWRVRGQIAFIGLSTACPKPPLMATGTVDELQLQRLPNLLDRARERGLFRVVHLHHSPLPGREKWRKRLTNAAAVKSIISAGGAELVLHGHGHRALFEELDTRDGPAPVISVPSASALGLHGGNVASYNHYAVERSSRGWSLRVAMRRYDRDSGEFGPGPEQSVRLRRS